MTIPSTTLRDKLRALAEQHWTPGAKIILKQLLHAAALALEDAAEEIERGIMTSLSQDVLTRTTPADRIRSLAGTLRGEKR